MIDIKRTRYVVVDVETGNIFCGLARHYEFKNPREIGDTAIKTYLSETKARASFEMSWGSMIYDREKLSHRKWEWGKDFKIIRCTERLQEEEDE